METQAARWVWVGLILDGSVIGLLLVLIASRLDKKARQSLDDDSLLPVVELLPQVRLRNRDVVEVQNQLRHGSPGLPPILLAARQTGAGEHRRGREAAAGHPASRRAQEPAARRRQAYSLSSRQGSATCCRRAERARTASRRASELGVRPPEIVRGRGGADA